MFKAILDDQQVVAVKFLNPKEVNPKQVKDATKHRDKFESEVAIMQLCKHHNVVACLGAWITDSLIYSVCEFAENGDLFDALASDDIGEFSWYRR